MIPASLADYTNSIYNQDGTLKQSAFNQGPSDKEQEDYLASLQKKQQDFNSQYGIGSAPSYGNSLHQVGTALGTAAAASALGIGGGAAGGGALAGLLAAI